MLLHQLYVVCGDVNSGPHTCVTSTLPIKSPSRLLLFLISMYVNNLSISEINRKA